MNTVAYLSVIISDYKRMWVNVDVQMSFIHCLSALYIHHANALIVGCECSSVKCLYDSFDHSFGFYRLSCMTKATL